VTNLFEILAPPTRQAILRMVWIEEVNAGRIADQMASKFDVTFGAVSQHLAVLREAGLVAQRKQGRERWYRATREPLGPIAAYLESMWFGSLMKLKSAAEKEEQKWQKKPSKFRSR
jgi:DNA-binding transcriptional ArsR family regulator